MALISCAECGKNISSKAKSCPHCGCPIVSAIGQVAIKIPRLGSPFFSRKVQIIECDTNRILWTGFQGEIARFEIDKRTSIAIKFGGNATMSGVKDIKGEICANKKYTCVQDLGIHLFATYRLTEVDIIDS